jgi:hypothetical protein
VTIVYWLILALNDESTRRERLFPLQVRMMDGNVANVVSPSAKSLDFAIFIASVDPSANQFRHPVPIDMTASDEYGLVDYGNLDIYLMVENVTRVIYRDFWEEAGEVRDLSVRDDDMDAYYSFDDDELRNPYKRYEDEGIKNGDNHCRRVAWHQYQFPNCNTFHEMNSAVNVPRYLSYGAYRDVFGHWNHHDAVIWKQSSFKPKVDFTYDMYEFTRMDALVSERLSSNELIVDIYGHCGLSILSELMSNGDLEDATIKGEGYSSAKDLDDADAVKPQNDFAAEDKLLIALEMAKCLAVLHDFPDGRIVHDDVQLSQFLYNSNGTIKLNDFNRAEIMLWDDEKKDYCRYRNNPGNGNVSTTAFESSLFIPLNNHLLTLNSSICMQYRAPEEYWDWPLNEKIDVYSFGNNIYALLTGMYPFYEIDYYHEVKAQEKIKSGEKPFVDPRYRNRSYAEGKLVGIMEACWAYHAEERPALQTVIAQLQEAADYLEEHKEEHSSKVEQENS